MPRISTLFKIYCRREPTTDANAKAALEPAVLATCLDWVFYRDPLCTSFYCRIPWHYTKTGPRPYRKTITLNCVHYRLIWVR